MARPYNLAICFQHTYKPNKILTGFHHCVLSFADQFFCHQWRIHKEACHQLQYIATSVQFTDNKKDTMSIVSCPTITFILNSLE